MHSIGLHLCWLCFESIHWMPFLYRFFSSQVSVSLLFTSHLHFTSLNIYIWDAKENTKNQQTNLYHFMQIENMIYKRYKYILECKRTSAKSKLQIARTICKWIYMRAHKAFIGHTVTAAIESSSALAHMPRATQTAGEACNEIFIW